MRRQDLIEIFKREDVVDKEDYPSRPALELLAKLATTYERQGLLRGADRMPLRQCCPHGADCWRGLPRPQKHSRANTGEITLPWVGPRYRRGGVVLVAINLHDASGLLTEYEITCSSAGRPDHPSQIGSFEAGGRKAHRSPFAYGSTRSAAMLLDALAASVIKDREAPHDLIDPLERLARLQAVKCSPETDRSRPTSAMQRNCPPLLLHEELEVLQPRKILTIGRTAAAAVNQLPGYQPTRRRGRLAGGALPLRSGSCAVYSIAHPVAVAHWRRDHEALKRFLARRPSQPAPAR
jgi:hypothetical protein